MHTSPAVLIIVAAIAGLAACAKGGSAQNSPTGSSADQTKAPKWNVCSRHLITDADAAGVLAQPITTSGPLEFAPETCRFRTAGPAALTIRVGPGIGDASLNVWMSGRMASPSKPISGVGDRAVWVPGLNTMSATHNNLLCEIEMGAMAANSTSDAQQEKMKALCNKVFAAVR